MVIILPQSGQLQNYLKGDLAELENYLWARVESKRSKTKKIRATYMYVHGWQEIGRSFSRLSRFHPPFYIFVCFSSFLRRRRHVLLDWVRLKSSFFDTVWVYRDSRNAFRGTFGLVFGETYSKYSFDKLAFTRKRLLSTCSVSFLCPLFS